MKKITVNDCIIEFLAHKLIYGAIFFVVFLSVWAYSTFFVPYYYIASYSVTLPTKIDINIANTATQILNGKVMPYEPEENSTASQRTAVSYSAFLSASGDVVKVSFSSTNRQKLIAFQEEYEKNSMPKVKKFIQAASGVDSDELINVIDYKYPLSNGKTFNVFAILLLGGIIVVLCDILVVLRKESRQ